MRILQKGNVIRWHRRKLLILTRFVDNTFCVLYKYNIKEALKYYEKKNNETTLVYAMYPEMNLKTVVSDYPVHGTRHF